MGAYRAGADALLDRAIAMQDPMRDFLTQAQGDVVPLGRSAAALAELLGAEANSRATA